MANVTRKSTITENTSSEDREENINRQKREKRKPKLGLLDKLNRRATGADENTEKDKDGNQESRFLLDSFPYYITPSYTHHNGKVTAIVEMYVRSGTNRDLDYQTIIDMIPVESLDGVEMFFITKDGSIAGDAKKRLIRENAKGGKDTIGDTVLRGADEDRENQSTQQSNEADVEDYNTYELEMESAAPIIVFNINLVVVGPDRETVEEQIEILNRVLHQRFEGAEWDSLGGDQTQRLTNLFTELPFDRFQKTSTSANYAGLNFSVNAGLRDTQGLPVGVDVLSLTGSTAFFDMDGSLTRQSLISIPRGQTMSRYELEDDTFSPSSASILAQYAANQAVMEANDNRAHHLVLNDFDYMERGRYFRPLNAPGVFDYFDVSNVTINPLEGFGDIEDVVEIYNRKVKLIGNLFNIINDLNLNEIQRGIISDATTSFYNSQGLWFEDAANFPARTRLVNIPDPESYPTLGNFINEFTTIAYSALKDKRENRADSVEALEASLKQSLSAYRQVMGRPTSIRKSDARQVIYDFNKIGSDNVRQVQFLNLLEYVTWTASRGDVIVIHGMDNLWAPVLAMCRDNITAAQRKGIRFLFAFDVITRNDTSTSNTDIKYADPLQDMNGLYYTDIHSGMDWSVIGQCLPDEVDLFETRLNTRLSDTIRARMQESGVCQTLVTRKVGDVNSFVNLQVVI